MRIRPLIEQWFPVAMVGAESLRERKASSSLPPINYLHVWWARRPLTTSRAAVVASLLPAWPQEEEAQTDPEAARVRKELLAEFPAGEKSYHDWFLRLIGIAGDPVAARRALSEARSTGQRIGNPYGYDRAFTRSPSAADIERFVRLAKLRASIAPAPVLLDPFAGGGSIPFEAARFGCATIANELNPVAAAILTGTVDLPFRLAGSFSGIIRYWGKRWETRVRDRLALFFPVINPDEKILSYIWAHTVPCPLTDLPTPLSPNFWLARQKGGPQVAVRLEPDPQTGQLKTEIVEGSQAARWGNFSTYKRGTGISIWTNQTFDGKYISKCAQAGKMGEMLLAVCVTRPGRKGRQFRPPTQADLEAVEAARAEVERLLPAWEVADLVPKETIPSGYKTREPQRMGFHAWRQLFTPRQLLTTVTALQELHNVIAEAKKELPEDQAKALALYLALALDKAVDYNSVLSSWDATRAKIRDTFDRHDFSFKWSFAEEEGAHSLIPWVVDQVADAYEGIARLARPEGRLEDPVSPGKVLLGSASHLPDVASGTVDAIVTDPPYYDNVMYGELADFFLVWLKRALRDTWPEFCRYALSDKQLEAVANPSLFQSVAANGRAAGRRPGAKTASDLADQHYELMLSRCFQEAFRVLKDDGVMIVMFTHKKVEAWDTLGQALLEAGFSINSSWPVHTESEHSLHQAGKAAANSTILLTCSKRTSQQQSYWIDIRKEVAEAAREAAKRFAEYGIHGVDLTLATFGPVLSVLSRHWPVFTGDLDQDGNPIRLRPGKALDLAREEVAKLKIAGLLEGRSEGFDRVTNWWLLAWSDFQAPEFPSGEAIKLCMATHVELEELTRTYVARSAGGKVSILSPAIRHANKQIDPSASSFPVLLDALHCLMLIYEDEGANAAGAWLKRTGLEGDPRFRDLLRAALRAVPRIRKKETGEFAIPEARTLEGLRITLFDDIPAPPERTEETPLTLPLTYLDNESEEQDDGNDSRP